MEKFSAGESQVRDLMPSHQLPSECSAKGCKDIISLFPSLFLCPSCRSGFACGLRPRPVRFSGARFLRRASPLQRAIPELYPLTPLETRKLSFPRLPLCLWFLSRKSGRRGVSRRSPLGRRSSGFGAWRRRWCSEPTQSPPERPSTKVLSRHCRCPCIPQSCRVARHECSGTPPHGVWRRSREQHVESPLPVPLDVDTENSWSMHWRLSNRHPLL